MKKIQANKKKLKEAEEIERVANAGKEKAQVGDIDLLIHRFLELSIFLVLRIFLLSKVIKKTIRIRSIF